MRVLMVLVALVAAPVVASVAQESGHHDSESGHHDSKVRRDARHSVARRADVKAPLATPADCEQEGQHEGSGCSTQTLPPPPPPPPPTASCSPSGAQVGTYITGQVYHDGAATPNGLAGWCLELRINSAVVATALSDASGNYTFSGLAGDPTITYLVCEVKPSGWTQTWPTLGVGTPACPSTLPGYSFSGLAAGFQTWFNNFGNK
jgi:hypothetical protein